MGLKESLLGGIYLYGLLDPRPKQLKAISSIIQKKDTIIVVSYTYQESLNILGFIGYRENNMLRNWIIKVNLN